MTIYALGSNGSGQLGIGHQDDTSTPQAVLFDHERPGHVNKIVAGGNHTVVLDSHGNVYTSGSNEDGRCGQGDIDMLSEMRKLDTSFSGPICDISATWSATFLLATDRRVLYACGRGDHGELGLGSEVPSARLPLRLAAFGTAKINHLTSGISHTLAVLDDGQVWAWGKGRKGQLGEPAEDQWSPKRIEQIDFAAVTAVAGSDFTCVFGRPQTNGLLLLGSDKRDRFSLRAHTPSFVPSALVCTASWGTVYVLLPDQTVHAWGRDDRGQIPPADLPLTKAIAAGSEHWVALSASGGVLTGGWGEHGNCGPHADAHGVVKGRANSIAVTGSVVQVFAGCATTFIVVE